MLLYITALILHSAGGGVDYIDVDVLVTFTSGSISGDTVTVTVDVVDDDRLENVESFIVAASSMDQGVMIQPATTTISIIASDGMS